MGYVVAYVGDLGGIVPYTAYNARKSYIENNQDIIQNFTDAIYKGQQYVQTHTSKEIATLSDRLKSRFSNKSFRLPL